MRHGLCTSCTAAVKRWMQPTLTSSRLSRHPCAPEVDTLPEQFACGGKIVHVPHTRTDKEIHRPSGKISAWLSLRVRDHVTLPHGHQHRYRHCSGFRRYDPRREAAGNHAKRQRGRTPGKIGLSVGRRTQQPGYQTVVQIVMEEQPAIHSFCRLSVQLDAGIPDTVSARHSG